MESSTFLPLTPSVLTTTPLFSRNSRSLRPLQRTTTLIARIAPAHRASDRPPAGPQPDRHQRVLFIPPHITIRQPGSGKAQQQTTGIHPVLNGLGFSVGQRRNISKDDDIGIGGQDIRQRAVQQIGSRGKRLSQVMRRRQKLQPLTIFAPREQGHFAPAQTVIGKGDSARMPNTLDLKPDKPVSQFGWNIEPGERFGLAYAELCRGSGQIASDIFLLHFMVCNMLILV